MGTFFCRALDVPELQYHPKELVNDMRLSWTQIFERIQKDYRSIESTEALRSSGELLKNRLARRAARFNTTPSGKHPGKPPVRQPRFPLNTGNLLPHKYYLQFKEWYEEMSKPKEEKNPKFFSTFKFQHINPKTKYVREPSSKNKREDNRRRSKRGRRRERSDSSSSEEERSSRRRKKKNLTDSRDKARQRGRSRSRSSSPSEDERQTKRGTSERKSRRGKPHSKEKGEADPRTKVGTRDKAGTPPMKCGKSPLFDSGSSSSSDSNLTERVVLVPKMRHKATKKVEKEKGREASQSPVTSRSPVSGRRYSDSLSINSDCPDDVWDADKRRLHDIRHGRLPKTPKQPKNKEKPPPFTS